MPKKKYAQFSFNGWHYSLGSCETDEEHDQILAIAKEYIAKQGYQDKIPDDLTREELRLSLKNEIAEKLGRPQALPRIPGTKIVDYTGQQFGLLTVVELDEELTKEKKHPMWRCACRCGQYRTLYIGHLKSGTVYSCGCTRNPASEIEYKKKIEEAEIGKRYGMLTVLSVYNGPKRYKQGGYWFNTRCDCGKELPLPLSLLHNGSITSCGCGQSENRIPKIESEWCGKKIGMATPIRILRPDEFDMKDKDGNPLILIGVGRERLDEVKKIYEEKGDGLRPLAPNGTGFVFLAKCDCGNEFITTLQYLKDSKRREEEAKSTGKDVGVLSCGCYGFNLLERRFGADAKLQQTEARDNPRKFTNRDYFVEGTNIAFLGVNTPTAASSTGYRGVTLDNEKKKYRGTIIFRGKLYYFGSYTTAEEANRVLVRAREHMHGDFLDWYENEFKAEQARKKAESKKSKKQ